jgi:MFS transporter, NNP family, nitrate/nitrite transporter
VSTIAFTVCFMVLMMFGVIGIPIKKMLDLNSIMTVNGPRTFHIGLNVYVFTGLMFILGIAWAFGKASVFKYISDDYSDNIGAISGIVGLAGGLGGFILPIMFGALMDLTGIRSSAFMLMYGVVWVSLIWMYWTEVRKAELMGYNANSFMGTRINMADPAKAAKLAFP